jgi:phenylacetate-coenzyme A ligase PaaK-like adenylate-forming protein
MSLIDRIIESYFKLLAKRLENAANDPAPWQAAALKRLHARIGRSNLAAKTGFNRVRSTEDMRGLPITDYSMIKELVNEVANKGLSASQLFGRSQLVSMALTSGTTAEPKRVPINEDYVSSYRRFTLGMNAAYAASTNDKFEMKSGGKTLLLTARPLMGKTPGGLSEGFISGFMASQTPKIYKNKILPSRKLMFVPTWEEKMDAVMDEARNQQVISIAGVPALVLSFTERALKRFDAKVLREIWPDLDGLLYSGVALSQSDREKFSRLWGATSEWPITFWEMYTSTEAQIGHTFDPRWPGMVFNAFDNFYQFLEDGEGPVLQLHELEAQKKYVILTTTPGGLINYRTGDWIEILSVNPLTFRIAGRDKDEISLSGEKVTALQLQQAVSASASRLELRLEEFAAWPSPTGDYQLIVALTADASRAEFDAGANARAGTGAGSDAGAVDDSSLGYGSGRARIRDNNSNIFAKPVPAEKLAVVLDEELCEQNPTYKELRHIIKLFKPLKVVFLDTFIFETYRRRNIDQGQFKQKRIFKSEAEFRKAYFPAIEIIGVDLSTESAENQPPLGETTDLHADSSLKSPSAQQPDPARQPASAQKTAPTQDVT